MKSVLFETKLVYGCLCLYVCVFTRNGTAVVILNQLIDVFWWTPALSLSPGDSSAFRWAYLNTHKPWHSQVVVCWVGSLSASSQSVNITDVPNDRHNCCGLCCSFQTFFYVVFPFPGEPGDWNRSLRAQFLKEVWKEFD